MKQNRYAKQSRATDPDAFAPLLEVFPKDAKAVMRGIHSLLIHPANLNQHPTAVFSENEIWEHEPRTVHGILAVLHAKNNTPLNLPRRDSEKAVITFRGFTLLLTAALRHAEIPARARAGFADYLSEEACIDHWICEYWDVNEVRWHSLDADRMLVDPPLVSAAKAYVLCREGKADYRKFGFPDNFGYWYILSYLNVDLLSVLGLDEPWYNPDTDFVKSLVWQECSDYETATASLSPEIKRVVDRLAVLMREPDQNRQKLMDLLKRYPQFLTPSARES